MRRAILEQAEKRGIQFKKTITPRSAETGAREEAGHAGGMARLVAAPGNANMADFAAEERSAIAKVFENAKSVRVGNAKDDTRWMTSSHAVVPDVVVTIGTVNDWNLLYQTLNPGRLKKVTDNSDMILQVEGQTILLTDGGC